MVHMNKLPTLPSAMHASCPHFSIEMGKYFGENLLNVIRGGPPENQAEN